MNNHRLSHQMFVSIRITCRQLKTILFAIICVVNAYTVVEDYKFDEYDEIQCVDMQRQETSSLSDISPSSEYLKHQQTIYRNTITDEDTVL